MTITKRIDLTSLTWNEPETYFDFSGVSPTGETLAMNNRHFIRNGQPWFPVMGEFHFSRYPQQYWEDELLKMKSGGIDIVAVYVFWIHHEEVEGEFDWSGQRNLGEFIRLCHRHGLYVWLRPGPWCHGECRNGGFPDWLQNGGFETRCDSQPYLGYVERFFREIAKQLAGRFFRDGGPIIGIQLENEYGHCGGLAGEAGAAHIRTLKGICRALGLVAPFYTTTAWGGAVVVEGETIPVFGGYVEAPWDQHIHEQPASREYLFHSPVSETTIGTDLMAGQTHGFSFDPGKYPYLTAELGGGVQVTQHRRPYITGDDIEASVLAKLASGISAIGYYMYHGGTNPAGKLTTLQESKATGMYNDLPELSYDFQAPLREYGQMHESYGKLRRLHMFLRDFGYALAQTQTYLPGDLPTDAEDMETLRYSLRYGPAGSFLFLNNYQRRRQMTAKRVGMQITTQEGTLALPVVDLPDGARWILPLQMLLGGLFLEWSTAQLLCRVRGGEGDTYVFFADRMGGATLRIRRGGVAFVAASGAAVEETATSYVISVPTPGKDVSISLRTAEGSAVTLLVLDADQAGQAVKASLGGREYLVLTDADQFAAPEGLRLLSRHAEASLFIYPAPAGHWQPEGLTRLGAVGLFAAWRVRFVPRGAERTATKVNIPAQEMLGNGGLAVEFELNGELDRNALDWFLKVRFQGDKARLSVNGKPSADWFYLGDDWEVGLKRFVYADVPLRIRLEVDPLHADDFVYLDRRPEFTDGVCCRLDSLSVEPEFSVLLESLA